MNSRSSVTLAFAWSVLFMLGMVAGLEIGSIMTLPRTSPLGRAFSISLLPLLPIVVLGAAVMWWFAVSRWPDVRHRTHAGLFVAGVALSWFLFWLVGREWLIGRAFEGCVSGRPVDCASLSSLVSRRHDAGTSQLRDALYCRECALNARAEFCARLIASEVCESRIRPPP
jgi:hypothetical protein